MSISIEPVVFTDDAAESYIEGTIEVLDPVYDFFAAEIAKLVGKNARILDVGTGHGIVIGKVARLTGAETIGVDASPCILRKARAAYPNTSFQVHDASRLGFKDSSFDIVFSTLAFHHFDRPSALKEMLRVLKPSGTLIIFDFDGRIHPVLFASLLGYNPVQTLLGPHVLHLLPASHAAYLTGQGFFPALISGPFAAGLTTAFAFAIAACVIAAIASWLRGGKYIYADSEPRDGLRPSPIPAGSNSE